MWIRIPTDKVGVVYRKFGAHNPEDKFQIRMHGSPGYQAEILHPDRRYYRPQFQYRIDYAPITYVPPGSIGVVVALDGANMPSSQTLAKAVDCNSFQDAERFLANGGQMGRQPDVLSTGKYYINPRLFRVLTVESPDLSKYGLIIDNLLEISIPEGQTGVVVALEGAPSDDHDHALGRRVEGHERFQDATAFLKNGGQHGAQTETLGAGGVYRINPWFARVVIIPTRDLILEWSSRERKSETNFDAFLDQIRVNIEGFHLRCTMSQTIRIPPRSAPTLVQRFGEVGTTSTPMHGTVNKNVAPVQRFVERVLGATVESYFTATANDYGVVEFFRKTEEVRDNLEDRVRNALADWGVEAVRTALSEFVAEDDEINELRRKIATEREQIVGLEYRERGFEVEKRMELGKIEIEAERNKATVAAEAEILRQQIELLGRDHTAMRLFLEQVSQMNVPQYVGSDAGMLLEYMPLQVAQNLINRIRTSLDPEEQSQLPSRSDKEVPKLPPGTS